MISINLFINFKNNSSKPKYLLIYEHIKSQIIKGRLAEGCKLPSIRDLSTSLKVSKSTIEGAYNQLLSEGYIKSIDKRGYFVISIDRFGFNLNSKSVKNYSSEPTDKSKNYNSIEEDSFNFNLWKKVNNNILDYEKDKLLNYGDSNGEYILRYEIAKFIYESRGGICTPDQIVVGAGTQYLFGLIATIFRKFNSTIAFEYPGFSKGMYVFEDYGYNPIKIPIEEDGINLNVLKKSNAKIVYVSPSHQYPMGNIMSINNRINLINWAIENNSYIIEDDYDSIFRYEGHPIPALQGLNSGKNIIYIGSFSKLLIPSIRISFMILPEDLIPIYNSMKNRYTQSVSKLEQLTLAKFMSEGYFERHLRRLKKILNKKNQILLEAFKNYPSINFKVVGKESGLHVVLFFNKNVDLKKVACLCNNRDILLENIDNYLENRILIFPYSGISNKDIPIIVKKLVQIIDNSLYN